eukprot:CAMPEP_0175120690 /NCGR_PEP_ID=MMETSP0087-20121206/758_1 /TAXON_ID=136419 /ORGANISM="Unknown Unknown, Strain D1" /LENGTH=351 /DNA_ID=CAMNT_0016402159 /DNA_START=360 /DNA_END=1415 /DNA_ORIENTATION=+
MVGLKPCSSCSQGFCEACMVLYHKAVLENQSSKGKRGSNARVPVCNLCVQKRFCPFASSKTFAENKVVCFCQQKATKYAAFCALTYAFATTKKVKGEHHKNFAEVVARRVDCELLQQFGCSIAMWRSFDNGASFAILRDSQPVPSEDETCTNLYVVFRGTCNFENVVTDMKTTMGIFPFNNTCKSPNSGQVRKALKMKVHQGFLELYLSVRLEILSALQNLLSLSTNPKVVCLGHSLGGALATLLALDLKQTLLADTAAACLESYTFGCPRVGDPVFASQYNSLVPYTYRVVNEKDVVPAMPLRSALFPYIHVGTLCLVRSKYSHSAKDAGDCAEIEIEVSSPEQKDDTTA